MKQNYTQKGFTLVELVVVVAIIGLLTTIVAVAIEGNLKKSRDAKRVADLKQIELSLEVYKEAHGAYPISAGGGGWASECNFWGGLAPEAVIPGLVPGILGKFPSDPDMNISTNVACYVYQSNGNDYIIVDHDTRKTDYESQPDLLDPTRDGGSNPAIIDGNNFWAWKISTPGAIAW